MGKLCDTCEYKDKYELDKPCVIYSDHCKMYKKKEPMTIEEAIKNIKEHCYFAGLIPRAKEALDVAIKALEQEPSSDLISRQAVQDYIAKYLSQYLYNDVREAVEVIDEYIGELPPVNPQEPKTGHWITKEAYSEDKAMGFTEQIVCSNCDMQNSYFSEWDECKNPISKTFIRSKFCPNCGCRMV